MNPELIEACRNASILTRALVDQGWDMLGSMTGDAFLALVAATFTAEEAGRMYVDFEFEDDLLPELVSVVMRARNLELEHAFNHNSLPETITQQIRDIVITFTVPAN